MTQVNTAQGNLLFSHQLPAGKLEIYQGAVGCVGYFDGVESVTAAEPYLVLRGLERKHVVGLPEGQLIDFREAALRVRG